MSRFEDGPELFGCGIGISTGYKIKCDMCGTIYNKESKDDEPSTEGDSVCYTIFAGLRICDCCFEKVENEILKRMDDILLELLHNCQ